MSSLPGLMQTGISVPNVSMIRVTTLGEWESSEKTY